LSRSADSERALLRVQGLTAGYRRPVVGPLSFEIHAGEIVGLWGANGTGKSTLLKAIARGGRVFSGRVQRAPGLRLAYQEQHPVRLLAMPLTGLDLLRAAGGHRVAVPGPIAPLLGRRLDRLSGGQYQLLSVWCALAAPSDLVLLDEPTNNLDPEAEALLATLLRAQPGRRAALVVSHERAFLASACARVIALDDTPGDTGRGPGRREDP
jgi:ATPase subunit of ABC transporter with duplicated ATPase domains